MTNIIRALVEDIMWRCPDAKVLVSRRPETDDYEVRVRLTEFDVIDPTPSGTLERDRERLVQAQE